MRVSDTPEERFQFLWVPRACTYIILAAIVCVFIVVVHLSSNSLKVAVATVAFAGATVEFRLRLARPRVLGTCPCSGLLNPVTFGIRSVCIDPGDFIRAVFPVVRDNFSYRPDEPFRFPSSLLQR